MPLARPPDQGVHGPDAHYSKSRASSFRILSSMSSCPKDRLSKVNFAGPAIVEGADARDLVPFYSGTIFGPGFFANQTASASHILCSRAVPETSSWLFPVDMNKIITYTRK